MKKLAILFGMVLLMPVVSHADNTAAGTAAFIMPGEVSDDLLGGARIDIWFKTKLNVNRSYAIMAWFPGQESITAAPGVAAPMVFSDAGVTPATGLSTATEGEGSPASSGQDHMKATFEPAATGTYWIRLTTSATGVSPELLHVLIQETTLFSPWTSKAAGFEGFIELHNNTSETLNLTLRAFDQLGVLQGSGLTLTAPPNATVFRTATQVGVPVNVFAGLVLTHDGAPGAMSGNITTLNGANGLSFDSPFTGR